MTETVKDPNCGYCVQGEPLAQFGYLVGELPHSLVLIFKEQSHPGRLIVAYKEHVSELVDISDEERDAYFAEIAQVAKVMHQLYKPDKINYGAYGDGGSHLHFHLVPKYEGEVEWGTPFAMNLDQKYLSDDEYEAMAEDLRQALAL